MRRVAKQKLCPQTDCEGCWHEGGTEEQGETPKSFLIREQELFRGKNQAKEKGARPGKQSIVTETHVCSSANLRRLRIQSGEEQSCLFLSLSQTLPSPLFPSPMDIHCVCIPLLIAAPGI